MYISNNFSIFIYGIYHTHSNNKRIAPEHQNTVQNRYRHKNSGNCRIYAKKMRHSGDWLIKADGIPNFLGLIANPDGKCIGLCKS